jgi:tRNA(fMet)-specific endonuclease VapC
MRQEEVGAIAISSITYSELCFGVSNSSNPEQNATALAQFIAPLEVVDYTAGVAQPYGSIRSFLKQKGRLIGPLDLLIAAHAVQLDLTLVTNNLREFSRIPGLRVENWVR